MITHNFDKDWKFSYSTGNAYKDQNGGAYKEMVDLPHDFMIGTKRTPDAGTEGAGGFFQGGIGTYQKTFTVSEDKKDKQYLLLVEGSYGNTEVWINGNLATIHHYGYTEFYVDLTRWLKYEEENQLKIVVENNALPNSRWYTGSGLYRHVQLLEGDSCYLGPWSVAVTTPESDCIHVAATLTNTKEAVSKKVKVEILDQEGTVIVSGAKLVQCKAADENASVSFAGTPSSDTTCTFTFEKIDCKLWTLENPVMYQARVTVLDEGQTNQEQAELKTVDFGVRTISFSRENGFCLNGEPVKLKGGCIHHDNGIVGACSFDAMEERRIRLLKEAGYNAIRTSHNPLSTSILNACDRLGMLVLDEAFDCWRAKKNPFDYHLYFDQCWKDDLESMILRDRNHPSVIMYSIGNEIGERDGSGDGARISHDMCEYVRSLDNTRAITNGVCAIFLDAGEFGGILANIFGSGEEVDFASLPDEIKAFIQQTDDVTARWGELTADYVKDLDVVGYNYLDDRYEKDGVTFPDRLIVGTESYPKAMKQVWDRTMAHSYVLGDFTWTAFDYLGESGIGHAFYNESGGLFCDYPWHTGNCGDYDLCGYLRPQGKYRKLLWNIDKKPVITVLNPEHMGKKEAISTWGWSEVTESYSFPGCVGKTIRLDIYSDAPAVEIRINGQKVKEEAMPENWMLSTEVTYEPGTIEVVNLRDGVYAEKGELKTVGKVAEYKVVWENEKEKGADVYVGQVAAVDQEGNRVPYCQDIVKCELADELKLVGFGSANPKDEEEDYTSDTCKLYEGRALLVVKKSVEDAALECKISEVE